MGPGNDLKTPPHSFFLALQDAVESTTGLYAILLTDSDGAVVLQGEDS